MSLLPGGGGNMVSIRDAGKIFNQKKRQGHFEKHLSAFPVGISIRIL